MPFSDLIGHERPKAILKASILHDRVAHAYLFHGEDGIGKKLAAMRFAQAINCDTDYGPGGPDACGICQSCCQIEARTHPDFRLIEPDQELANPQIKIEQVRELEQQIVYRPLVGRRKVCLIDEADRLTQGAANALLKTLEEPTAHSLFLLITSRPSALPATVRSRCQAIRFVPPARTQVEAALITKREITPDDARFLAMATQARIGQALKADVAALRAQQDEFCRLTSQTSLQSIATLLGTAEALHKSDRTPEALEWLAQWVRDLVLVGVGADPDSLLNLERLPDLQQSVRSLQLGNLLDLLTEIETIQRSSGRNLNLQMALENILLRLREAVCVPVESRLP
ncbi:MAG: DNA polymerase III subunit delta' [Nitrospira sp.]|nr:DNA polymerase III subunit delta' [Nitrospira sp.]